MAETRPQEETRAQENDDLTISASWTSATDIPDLARRIVEAVEEAAIKRSRKHTVVYSVRPLDEEELERIGDYIEANLDDPDEWFEDTSETDVRIVVDGRILEGTLQVGDEPDLENVIDESLIMGIKIVRGDTVIDGSLKHQLDVLSQSMHS